MNPSEAPAPRYRLALFPLPVVLLPGAAMPLHIFEQRYRDMVTDCVENDRGFGMVYHDWDEHGPFLSEEGTIGCVARVKEHEALEDGRFLIVVEGTERFRIVDGVESESLYFEGLVSTYGDVPVAVQEDLIARRGASIELFRSVLSMHGDEPEALPQLDPKEELSFLLAQSIRVDPAWHQGLLELQDEGERLGRLDSVFRALLG